MRALGGAFGLWIAKLRPQDRESRKFVRRQVPLGSVKAVFGISTGVSNGRRCDRAGRGGLAYAVKLPQQTA
jgi:hypothetical protein